MGIYIWGRSTNTVAVLICGCRRRRDNVDAFRDFFLEDSQIKSVSWCCACGAICLSYYLIILPWLTLVVGVSFATHALESRTLCVEFLEDFGGLCEP
jgi:SNF family Na+-dependent transporter